MGGRREESLKLSQVLWSQLNIIKPSSLGWHLWTRLLDGRLERVRGEGEGRESLKLECLQTLSSWVGSRNETTGFDRLLELCFF